MIIATTVLLLIIIIVNNNINNNGNFSKNQFIWLSKCFLRLCLKVFKLSVFFNVSGIWFQNKGPIKDKVFWPVFVFPKGHLSFKKLLLKLTLPSGAILKTSFKKYRELPLTNLNTIEITHCSNLVMTGNQFKSLNSLWDIVDILSNGRQKWIHLFCIAWSLFLVFVFRYHAEHVRLKCGCIMALHNNRCNSRVKKWHQLQLNFFYVRALYPLHQIIYLR